MERSWLRYSVVRIPPLGLGRRRWAEGEQSFRDKDPWHAQGHYLVLDGLWIFHQDQGRGIPIILLHGLPTSSYLYRDSLPILAESHRIVALDLYGFGYSSKPKRPSLYQITAYAAFLNRFLDALELERVAIVAHGYASWATIEFALAHPERVSHLVMLGTALDFAGLPLDPRAKLLRNRVLGERIAALLLSKNWLKGTLRRWVVHKERITEAVVDHYYWPFTDGTRWVMLTLAHNSEPPSQPTSLDQQQLDNLGVPTLIVRGEADLRAGSPSRQYHRLDLPNSRQVFLEEAGHLVPEDQPEEMARLVLEFVSGS